jgi:hypothetical protein
MKEKHIVTNHLSEDRIDRAVFIATTIGFGEIIHKVKKANKEGKERCYCITNTGVIIVKTPDEKVVITMYIAGKKQTSELFNGKDNVPSSLWTTVCSNEKKNLSNKSNGKA